MQSVLPPSLPLASENPFSSEQECIEHIGGHAHHSSYAAGASDQLRREATFGHSPASILNPIHPSSNTSRCSVPRPDAQYPSGTVLSDAGSGSYSASPNSNASSTLGFSYPSTAPGGVFSGHLGLANNYSGASISYQYNPMSSLRSRSITDTSSTAMLPPSSARSPGIDNTVPPALGSSARDNYTTSTPGLLRHSHTLSPRHSDLNRYGSLPETPRSVLPTTIPMTTPGAFSSAAVLGYGTQPDRQAEHPPFNPQETFYDISCEGTQVIPNIDAKIDKGFFWSSDRVWTCYRRNYFAVTVSYGLTPFVPNGRLYITRNGKAEQIQAMAVALGAVVDGSNGKVIELIQHTPKRDKGPQLTMKKELLPPTPPGRSHEHNGYNLNTFHPTQTMTGPSLPLQNDSDSAHNYAPTSHTGNNYAHAFERIQFKSATANNGKRRAQQQYYHLIVELWANVQNPRDNNPDWVKIATKSSSPVVVRGRSPSHYSNEGPHNAGTPRGGSGSGLGAPGHHGVNSNGGAAYNSSYTRLGLGGSGGLGGSPYRGNTYSLHPSPAGSQSVSSASSLSGGPVEGLVGDHRMMDEEENKIMENTSGYQYYPHSIYETIPSKVETVALPLPDRRVKEEYATSWSMGNCGRFQGIESSRGYYPDVQAAPVGYGQ